MTAQEIFDTVVAHLRKQGRPAQDPVLGCSYHTVSGMKCAVGVLIPDQMYDCGMEGMDVKILVEKYSVPDYFADNITLLSDLQDAHDLCLTGADGSFVLNILEDKLAKIAAKNCVLYTQPSRKSP